MPSLSSLLNTPALRPWWRAVLVLLMGAVCVLAFMPAPPSLDISGGDKFQHILAFVCLAACAALSLQPGRPAAARVALAMLCFGIFIEWVQSGLPSRSAEWQDVVADAVGIAVGLLVVAQARRRLGPAR